MRALISRQIVASVQSVENRILLIRGQKVMLDSDLAELYGVSTKRLNEQVKRNLRRFPADFMFQVSKEEHQALRSHSAILETGRGEHSKYLPRVFTEQGVAMLSSVLSSDRAVMVNIEIMRAFVRLRAMLALHTELGNKLLDLERKYEAHDMQIRGVFEAIRQLMSPEPKPKRRIGFDVKGG